MTVKSLVLILVRVAKQFVSLAEKALKEAEAKKQ